MALEALEAFEIVEALEALFFFKPICLIFSSSYCVSWPSLLMLCFLIFLMFEDVMPYALWSCLLDATLLDLLYLMLRCLTFPASLCLMSSLPRYSFWSYLHVFTLLDLLYIRLMLPLDLPCVMLCCLIFSKSCFATRSGLHDATLLDCLYLMLRW